MSSGGVFRLIANDGKADRMIMATELLNQRIKEIICQRAKQGYVDPTPTLVDIERTHILFVNAHFKPFAAIAYEYGKVRTNAGNPQYGSSVQFSIPQFGDFLNDMVIVLTLAATAATPGTVPPFPPYIGTDHQTTTTVSRVSSVENPTSGIFTQYTQEYVDISGAVQTVGAPATNFVRYAEYPGQRIFRRVKFEVNGNPLDDYTAESVMFHQKFKIGPHKMTGWKRLLGQEIPIEAYSDLVSITGASNFSTASTGLLDVTGAGAVGAPVNSAVTARKYTHIVCGPQTPQALQPALTLWVPLLFWFNLDPRLSVASVSIPFGMRYITVDIEAQNNILFTAPGNLFLRLTVEQTTSTDAATMGTIYAKAVQNVSRWTTHTPVLASGSTIDATQAISNIELYINNIFVNPEIHDIYIKRIGFSLIRIHRHQVTSLRDPNGEVLLSQLKWPIETMYVGIRPAINISPLNPNQYRDWHRLTALTDNSISSTAKSLTEIMTDDTVTFGTPVKHKTSFNQSVVERYVFPSSTETINTLQLQAQSINIFSTFDAKFFRDYISYTFGGINIITPEDPGAMMINFCLFPGTYQPSGHVNVSRAREFYLHYSSNYVSSTTPGDLLTEATAINFLLISDGSAILRYST